MPRHPRSRRSPWALGTIARFFVRLPGHEVLVTTDFTLETVHFRREWHSPESVGHRCLARGLSDLGAMGAKPLAAFLSLALPEELVRSHAGRPSWRERFFDGFLSLADKYNVPLAGGDTAESPLIAGAAPRRNRQYPRQMITGLALMDIVLVGTAPRGRSLRRSTAIAGDRIYVTGWLGGAAAELAQLAAHPGRFRERDNCNGRNRHAESSSASFPGTASGGRCMAAQEPARFGGDRHQRWFVDRSRSSLRRVQFGRYGRYVCHPDSSDHAARVWLRRR